MFDSNETHWEKCGFEKTVAPISDSMSNIFVFELFISPLDVVSTIFLKIKSAKKNVAKCVRSTIFRATEKRVMFFHLNKYSNQCKNSLELKRNYSKVSYDTYSLSVIATNHQFTLLCIVNLDCHRNPSALGNQEIWRVQDWFLYFLSSCEFMSKRTRDCKPPFLSNARTAETN